MNSRFARSDLNNAQRARACVLNLRSDELTLRTHAVHAVTNLMYQSRSLRVECVFVSSNVTHELCAGQRIAEMNGATRHPARDGYSILNVFHLALIFLHVLTAAQTSAFKELVRFRVYGVRQKRIT